MAGWSLEQVDARSARAHGLTEPAASISEAIVAAAGVYGTAPTSHLSLAARLDGYAPALLDRQRLEARSVLRVPGPRGSVFLAPRALVPAFLGLSRSGTARRTLLNEGISGAEQERSSERVEAALAGGSMTARELRKALGANDPGGPPMTLLLRALLGEGRIVAAEAVGGQRATTYRYARMAEWAPDVGPPLPAEEALALLAPLWMRANGPATIDDLAWWAGVTKRQAMAALRSLDVHTVVVKGLAGEQLATDEVIDGLSFAAPAGVVRFLPVWDTWLMARRERTRLLDDAHRPYVVDRSGNATNTITVDGRVVGVWDEDGEVLLVSLFDGRHLAGSEEAADRLRQIVDWSRLELVEPRALPIDRQNAFRAPLRARA